MVAPCSLPFPFSGSVDVAPALLKPARNQLEVSLKSVKALPNLRPLGLTRSSKSPAHPVCRQAFLSRLARITWG